MRVSLRWLQDYIDLKDMSVLELSATLTQLGLEVEGVETIQPLTGPVVVGQIKKAVQHPNADKLRLCDVDVGESEPLQIVCGAPNARDGLKVVVARVGSILPRDFKIKDSKIRGEASFGMLCSEQELGLSESHDGIIELPESAPIGAFIPDYLQL
ncbi:MAG: YtpR family tRNA-binding protein, partial [Oligoflexus sp.]